MRGELFVLWVRLGAVRPRAVSGTTPRGHIPPRSFYLSCSRNSIWWDGHFMQRDGLLFHFKTTIHGNKHERPRIPNVWQGI